MSESLILQLIFAAMALFGASVMGASVMVVSSRIIGRLTEQKRLVDWAASQESVVRDAIDDWLTARRTFGDI